MIYADDSCKEYAEDTFYTVVIECAVNEKDAFIQIFWTWAQDIGEALAKVLAVAKESEELPSPVATDIDPYDFDTLPDDVNEIGGTSVFTSGSRFYFPADEHRFIVPRGIIPSSAEAELSPGDLCAGFTEYADGDLLRIDCLASADRLEETFYALPDVLPGIPVSWIECSDKWDEAGTRQFYANEALNTPALIRGYLHAAPENVLHNGMVKFTAYSEEGATNLLIDDHKEVCVITYSRQIGDGMAEALRTLGYEKSEDLKTVSAGLYHWHYTPFGALPRREFIEQLQKDGFSLWKELPADPA